MTDDASRYPFPRWYLLLSAAVGIVATAGLVLGVVGVMVNNQQGRENARLLDCLDDYASASSASSSAVRIASAHKDEVTAVRDDALNAEGKAFQTLIERILAEDVKPSQVKDLADTLRARNDAARELDEAQAALDKARRENPVPEAPSSYCSTD